MGSLKFKKGIRSVGQSAASLFDGPAIRQLTGIGGQPNITATSAGQRLASL